MTPEPHDELANEQEAVAADLERRSDDVGRHIDAAKEDLAGLESSDTIPTPDEDVDPEG